MDLPAPSDLAGVRWTHVARAAVIVALAAALLGWTDLRAQQLRPGEVIATKQVLGAEEARRLAMLHGDVQVLDTLLADDVTIIWGDGTADGKASLLAQVHSGDLRYSRLDLDSTRVRIYGRTAVVTGRGVVRLWSQDHTIATAVRTTRVWVREGARWRLVANQTTRIPAAP